ncbi:MAG: hypothetical protein IE881_07380 [Epsilonproteobacteria bacterium]|nr:hypothetical protein [Campylobacterota bacterium]
MHTIHFMFQEKESVGKTLIISFIMQYLFKEVAQNPSFSLMNKQQLKIYKENTFRAIELIGA